MKSKKRPTESDYAWDQLLHLSLAYAVFLNYAHTASGWKDSDYNKMTEEILKPCEFLGIECELPSRTKVANCNLLAIGHLIENQLRKQWFRFVAPFGFFWQFYLMVGLNNVVPHSEQEIDTGEFLLTEFAEKASLLDTFSQEAIRRAVHITLTDKDKTTLRQEFYGWARGQNPMK